MAPGRKLVRLSAFFVAAGITLVLSSVPVYADTSVGVVVDTIPTTTTEPPTTTTEPPTTTTTQPPTTIAPTTTIPATTATTIPETPTTLTTDQSLVEVLPPVGPVKSEKGGIVAGVKSAAKTTKNLVNGITSGRPVADVAQEVLPAPVASVVVPAVRTASTFAFPIGLAFAVVAFLILQQRVDSGDPKLTAAPLAHDDDVVMFS